MAATSGDGAEENTWFSAVLRVVCFVDDPAHDELLQDEPVHVFRAPDREAAFQRALALGRDHETEYLNHEGSVVQWRFARIVELQEFTAESIDGAEVSSHLSRTDYLPFDTEFDPSAHPPDD